MCTIVLLIKLLNSFITINNNNIFIAKAQQDPKMAKVMYLPLAEKMLDKFDRMTALAELRLFIMVLEMMDKPE